VDSLVSVFIIGCVLSVGYGFGVCIPKSWVHKSVKYISRWVLALLFVTGYNFGEHLLSPKATSELILTALGIALLANLGVVTAILLLYCGQRTPVTLTDQSALNKQLVFSTLWEIAKVALVILGGVLLNFVVPSHKLLIQTDQVVMFMLYVLIFMVGMDLTLFRFKEQIRQLSLRSLWVPWLVVLGSWVGVSLSLLWSNLELKVLLALSSGFGWFSLSGVMVEQYLGAEMGVMGLLVDLFRELMGIFLIVAFGRFHYAPGVGVSGAAAMDSALPIIKNACAQEAIPLALYSGVVLTVCAPILLGAFLSQ
jgi:uncharacterized membrane protein YbjE (DUF340 family)